MLAEQIEKDYLDTSSPVFAWDALHMLLALDDVKGLPRWLRDYLGRVAMAMHRMILFTIPERDLPMAIYQALEFVPRRGVNPFRLVTDRIHDKLLATEVAMGLREGKKLDNAIVDAARAHPGMCFRRPHCDTISRSTVARVWKTYEPTLKTRTMTAQHIDDV